MVVEILNGSGPSAVVTSPVQRTTYHEAPAPVIALQASTGQLGFVDLDWQPSTVSGYSSSAEILGSSHSPLDPQSIQLARLASNYQVDVLLNPSLPWQISAASPWITVNQLGGTGTTSLTVAVAENSSGAARSGGFTLWVGGSPGSPGALSFTHSVDQGIHDFYVTPLDISIDSQGTTYTLEVWPPVKHGPCRKFIRPPTGSA